MIHIAFILSGRYQQLQVSSSWNRNCIWMQIIDVKSVVREMDGRLKPLWFLVSNRASLGFKMRINANVTLTFSMVLHTLHELEITISSMVWMVLMDEYWLMCIFYIFLWFERTSCRLKEDWYHSLQLMQTNPVPTQIIFYGYFNSSSYKCPKKRYKAFVFQALYAIKVLLYVAYWHHWNTI